MLQLEVFLHQLCTSLLIVGHLFPAFIYILHNILTLAVIAVLFEILPDIALWLILSRSVYDGDIIGSRVGSCFNCGPRHSC